MKTATHKTLLSLQARPTFVLLAATGLLGSACSAETSPPGGETSDGQTSSTASMTAQTTSTSSHSNSSSGQASTGSSSSHSSSSNSSSSHSSSSSASSASSNGSSNSGSTQTTTSPSNDSDTSNASGSSSSRSDDSAAASSDMTSTGSSETSTSSGGDSSEEDNPLSAGCGKEPTIASNMYNNGNPISITAADRQRRYILSVPTDYDNTKPYNLVIAWHQLDGNDKQMYEQNYYWIKAIPEAASSTIFRRTQRREERHALYRQW